jgi:RNA polymerase sigma-70 factor (ECF subfamily)
MFQAWFDRILVNGCRDRVRRRKIVRFVPIDPTVDPAADGDPFRAVLARDELLGGLDRLSADERAVVVLHYWTDLSVEQISARLGWPTGTVKSRLHRARRVLRDHLEARSGEVPS